jgi:DNA-directed RNA polymerase subunit RPC12/RpoP
MQRILKEVKNFHVCSSCGSSDVQQMAWTDVNTCSFKGWIDTETKVIWCNNCLGERIMVKLDEYNRIKNESDTVETVPGTMQTGN